MNKKIKQFHTECPSGTRVQLVKMDVDELIEQIISVRNIGMTNMFDTHAVQRIASEMRLHKLVIFIEENKEEYFDMILNG